MRGLVDVYKWLCAAFVTIMIAQWVAVGTPITTTRYLWRFQEFLAGAADSIADTAGRIDDELAEEELRHDDYDDQGYEGWYSSPTSRPLGSPVTEEPGRGKREW